MCDYSLAGMPNRLAVEGEELVVHRFAMGTLGLVSPNTPLSRLWSGKATPAVCVPPGTRLLLRNIPKGLQQEFGVREAEEVTFVQQGAEAYRYRDAVRFQNGREILLQRLKCGQCVDVLDLSSGHHEAEEHQRLEEEYRHIFL